MKKYILLALASLYLLAEAEFDNGKMKKKKSKKSKHKKQPKVAEKLKDLEAK